MSDDPKAKLAELERISAEQDARHEAKQAEHEATIAKITGGRSVTAYIEETKMDTTPKTTETDEDRLRLLDRIAERLPEVNLDDHEVAWITMPDGAPALVVDRGGIEGDHGITFANYGDDVHAIGPIPSAGAIGSMLIRPDGSRVLDRLVPDPAAKADDED